MTDTTPKLSPEQIEALRQAGRAAGDAMRALVKAGAKAGEAIRAALDSFKSEPLCRHSVKVPQCPFCSKAAHGNRPTAAQMAKHRNESA